jgi:hypothetical protein
LIRIATPETDGNLTPEEQHQIGNIMDHVLSILRMFDPELHRANFAGKPLQFGCFAKDDGSPDFGLRIKQYSEPVTFDPKGLQDVIAATAPLRVQMSLLAEAGHYATPIPFKFLCYYKVLELELRSKRKWIGLSEHLSAYADDFKQLGIGTSTLANFIHAYRDKCAHIKIGSQDELGLVGIGSKDAQVVSKFLPLFNRIVVELLNKKYGDRVQLSSTAEDGLTPTSPDQIPDSVRAQLMPTQERSEGCS